jgi:hypothetical protein
MNYWKASYCLAFEYLKLLTPEERRRKYGAAVIDLSLIWSRYLELKE